MPEDEAHSRWEDLHNHVITQTGQAFVTSFLTRCLRANTEHLHSYAAAGREQEVPDLSQDIGKVMGRWRHSDRRLVLVDWEGTLHLAGDDGAKESDALQILKKLSEDSPKNEVWLLSGYPVKGVLEKIAQEVPKIGIVYAVSSPHFCHEPDTPYVEQL
jgi:trehalose 6-phosphate synthase/phosphatase